jgi:hypothetical protein
MPCQNTAPGRKTTDTERTQHLLCVCNPVAQSCRWPGKLPVACKQIAQMPICLRRRIAQKPESKLRRRKQPRVHPGCTKKPLTSPANLDVIARAPCGQDASAGREGSHPPQVRSYRTERPTALSCSRWSRSRLLPRTTPYTEPMPRELAAQDTNFRAPRVKRQ